MVPSPPLFPHLLLFSIQFLLPLQVIDANGNEVIPPEYVPPVPVETQSVEGSAITAALGKFFLRVWFPDHSCSSRPRL